MPKLLAVDLDGTLFYPKKVNRCISKKNCKFLQHWIDEGNKVVLITSRNYRYIERLKKEIDRPFDCLTSSSAQIAVNNELVRDITIPRESLQNIISKIDEKYHPLGYLMSTRNQNMVIGNNHKAGKFLMFLYHIYYRLQFKYREEYVLDNEIFDKELSTGDAYYVMIFFGLAKKKSEIAKEFNKAIREEFPEIEASWSLIVVELTPKDCHKGAGLSYYCSINNISPDDVYVVGDSGNDIDMFKTFHEHSYCMAHSYPSVKKYAKHTISRVYKLDKLVLKGEKHESN